MAAIFTKYDLRLIKEKAGRYELERLINSSAQAGEICKEIFELETRPYEMVVMLTLNVKNNVIGCFEVARGTVNESPVYIREIATRALLSNAVSVILAHNHPGGSLKPSEADLKFTMRTKDALKLLGIKLLDHIIVSSAGYYSMAEQREL